MGFRTSLYCVPKEIAERYKNITEEEYTQLDDYLFNDLEKERIAYDVLTWIFMDDLKQEFYTRYFKNKLEIECDMFFGTVSKEQILKIIDEVRKRIYNYYNSKKVIHKTDGTVELGDFWNKEHNIYNKEFTPEDCLKQNQLDWNHKMGKWGTVWNDDNKTTYPDINIDINNKWIISGSWDYEYFIFDLIHIYKIFDWEHDTLMVIGG